MDKKNEVAHIEEKATHDSDSTSTQLLCSDGVVLIPQPTADPNGESPYASSARSSISYVQRLITDYRSSKPAGMAQMGHPGTRISLRLHRSSLGFWSGSNLPYGQGIISQRGQ
jgi:hypothetical protein